MSVATPKDRIARFAERGDEAGSGGSPRAIRLKAALKQALGVVTGDRRLEAEGAAERVAGPAAAHPARGCGRSRTEKRDAR